MKAEASQIGRSSKKERSLLPLDDRARIFREVVRLRQESRLYREIIEEIQEEFGVKLAKETISNWVRGVSSPLNAGHQFIAKPTPDLAYVIGVETGDAFLNEKRNNYQYRIRLRAVDVEFVEAFNRSVAKVLECPPHRLWKGQAVREIEVEFGSYLLHRFLSQHLRGLKVYVGHDQACMAAFLRGFFDSEGSVDEKGHLTATNTDAGLLRYVQQLLDKYFGIQAIGPHRGKKRGTVLTRRGKSYIRNSTCYYVYVRTISLGKFLEDIGLSITRKRVRLEKKLQNVR